MLSNLFCVALLFIGGEARNWRVVNGRRARFGYFPFIAAINSYFGSIRGHCSGSIIDRYTVLTAGHCVCKASSASVIVGVIDREVDSWPRQIHYSSKILVHPKYNGRCGEVDPFDVAIIKLKTAINFNSYVQPVGLFCKEPSTNRILIHLGYGLDENRRENILKYGYNKVTYDCDYQYICSPTTPNHIDSGDSGGPVVVIENNLMKQAGVISGFSTDMSYYANVPKACSWIKSKME